MFVFSGHYLHTKYGNEKRFAIPAFRLAIDESLLGGLASLESRPVLTRRFHSKPL